MSTAETASYATQKLAPHDSAVETPIGPDPSFVSVKTDQGHELIVNLDRIDSIDLTSGRVYINGEILGIAFASASHKLATAVADALRKRGRLA